MIKKEDLIALINLAFPDETKVEDVAEKKIEETPTENKQEIVEEVKEETPAEETKEEESKEEETPAEETKEEESKEEESKEEVKPKTKLEELMEKLKNQYKGGNE